MGEVVTTLFEVAGADGDAAFIITPNHTYADIIRFMLEELEPSEIKAIVDWVVGERDRGMEAAG